MSKRLILLISFLFALSIGASAQSTAMKRWPAFWNAFTKAVVNHNKPGIKRLMASEREFSSGGGVETRDEWLRMIENDGNWHLFVRSVRGGTRVLRNSGYKTPARITNDKSFIFVYLRGRWRFVGPMGH